MLHPCNRCRVPAWPAVQQPTYLFIYGIYSPPFLPNPGEDRRKRDDSGQWSSQWRFGSVGSGVALLEALSCLDCPSPLSFVRRAQGHVCL